MYAIYGKIYHQYTPNVSIYIYTIHGSYGVLSSIPCPIHEISALPPPRHRFSNTSTFLSLCAASVAQQLSRKGLKELQTAAWSLEFRFCWCSCSCCRCGWATRPISLVCHFFLAQSWRCAMSIGYNSLAIPTCLLLKQFLFITILLV